MKNYLTLGMIVFANGVFANCEDMAKGFGDVIPNQSDTVLNVGQDFDEVLDRGYMTFAVYEDFAPYSWQDDSEQPKGIDIDIAKEIASEIGVEAKFNFFAADENVDADMRNQVWKGPLINGEVSNVMMHVPYNKDLQCRNEIVVLGAQYFNESLATAYRKDIFPDEAPSTAYYRFHKVGVETHTISDFYLSNFSGGMLLPNIVHFQSHERAFDAMEKGEIDAVMGVKGILHNLDNSEQVEVDTPPLVGFTLDKWTLGIAVRHNFREIYYTVDGIIADMVADGRMKAVFESHNIPWGPPDY